MSETAIQSLASLAFASGWMFRLFDQLSLCKNMFEPTAYWSEILCYGSSFVKLWLRISRPAWIWWDLVIPILRGGICSHLSHLSSFRKSMKAWSMAGFLVPGT